MQSAIRYAIARIGVRASRGTGFLVADGLVLTALHGVADWRQALLAPHPGDIVLTFRPSAVKATIHETCWSSSIRSMRFNPQLSKDARRSCRELVPDGLATESRQRCAFWNCLED